MELPIIARVRATDRICGSCTACCRTHGVSEIKKPAGKLCIHCDLGKGCKIYTNRPPSCAGFECQWLQGYGKPEDRPNRSKIVVDLCTIPIIGPIAGLWEVAGGALKESFALWATCDILSRNIPVVLHPVSGKKTLVIPRRVVIPEDFVLGWDGMDIDMIPESVFFKRLRVQ